MSKCTRLEGGGMGWMGGPIRRNDNVTLSNLTKSPVALSILRKAPVALSILRKDSLNMRGWHVGDSNSQCHVF